MQAFYMNRTSLFLILFIVSQCSSYTNIPKNKNVFQKNKQNLNKNIEIYDAIKECNVSEINSCGDKCSLCLGKGVLICDYCHGTGFLTMGDIIIGTGNNCTVCMGKGEKECKRCMGSGYIARWRK